MTVLTRCINGGMEQLLFSKVVRILWNTGRRIDTVGYLLVLKYVVASLNGFNTLDKSSKSLHSAGKCSKCNSADEGQ